MHRLAGLAALFFLVSMSLGYPALSRYSARETPGLADVRSYASMVEGHPAPAYWHQYRVLVPALARPIRTLAGGKVGTWDVTAFSLLVVNSLFVAWATTILFAIGKRITGDPLVALSASLFYLLSFNVSNLMLAGLVDSVEAWALLAAVWSLVTHRWALLPLIGAVSAAGKETSVILLVVFCSSWYFMLTIRKEKTGSLPVFLVLLMIVQVTTIVLVQSALTGSLVSPLELELAPRIRAPNAVPLSANLLNREMLYTFAWLAPLGIAGIRRLPIEWIFSAAVTLITVAILAGVYAVEGNISRPAFNVTGPILILGSTILIADVVSRVQKRA